MYNIDYNTNSKNIPKVLELKINPSLSQPNLKCTQFGKYKKEYEEKIAIAEANIDKAVADCSAVVEIHTKLSAEKNELVLALSSGGSAVQVTYQNTYSDMTLKFKNMFSGHH